MEKIEIDGVVLEGHYGINDRREDFMTFLENTNGCGAGDAWIDFVPDTMYGLSVTPVCNLHDDFFTFCDPTRQAFERANDEFYSNLIRWIKAKSNFVMAGPRMGRAWLYYVAVKRKGWPAFCACKEALGKEIEDVRM